MNIKDLAKAFKQGEESTFLQKVDKEMERLHQLKFITKMVLTVKKLQAHIVPNHMNKNFKCTIESLHTFPQSWGLVYNAEGVKGKIQIDENDLEMLSKGLESITDNKLIDLASKGFNIENNFEEKLISMLMGKTILKEYVEHDMDLSMA